MFEVGDKVIRKEPVSPWFKHGKGPYTVKSVGDFDHFQLEEISWNCCEEFWELYTPPVPQIIPYVIEVGKTYKRVTGSGVNKLIKIISKLEDDVFLAQCLEGYDQAYPKYFVFYVKQGAKNTQRWEEYLPPKSLTFADLKVGEKFKWANTTTVYMKAGYFNLKAPYINLETGELFNHQVDGSVERVA